MKFYYDFKYLIISWISCYLSTLFYTIRKRFGKCGCNEFCLAVRVPRVNFDQHNTNK